ncbi:hypothetical protein BYT27DRAFT_7263777 [Phlegmacium glaucopus]|nr:hypothetical protein BYT27DRAFT_7263777 [Phlegmacium glaucopus]
MTIGTNLTASSRTFVWTSANVPQGWYSLSASISPVQELFYVFTGTNTSCLVVIPSGTGTTTITPVSTPASITSQSQSTTSSQASSPAAVVSAVVNIGIIVGVSLGVAALFITVVAGWLCHRKKKPRTISGKSGNLVHRWNGLSSTDSRVGFAAKPTNTFRSHHLSNPDSFADALGTGFEDDGIGTEKNKVSVVHG